MSKRRASQFLHLEAESDSEEYESEDYSEGLDDLTPLPPSKTKSFSQLTKELEERYRSEEEDDLEYEEEQATAEIPSQSRLLPTSRSPLLFLLRCKIGKEKEIVQKLFELAKGRGIISIIQKDGLKGYIYIESYKKQAIEDLLNSTRLLNKRRFSIVPYNEMVEAISYKKDIIVSDFARIKGGKYKGDLVKILENHEDVVLVKAIPRINNIKMKFEPDAYRNEVVSQNGGFYYKKDFYRNGYLEKIMLKSNLDFDVEPTFLELAEMDAKAFALNDKVRVMKGDLMSLEGRIANMSGNTVCLNHEGKIYEVNSNDLSKFYDVGEEVSYRSQNAVVLKMDKSKVILGLDDFSRTIECDISEINPPVLEKRENLPGFGPRPTTGGSILNDRRSEITRFWAKKDPLINQSVTITRGKFKGLHGIVKDSFKDKITIQIRSDFKNIVVDRSCILQEEPKVVQKTEPEVAPNRTPFKTPAYKTPAFKTPSLNVHQHDEAGTSWFVSPYEGGLVKSKGEVLTLRSYEDNIYTTKDGKKLFISEFEMCEPELYDKILVIKGSHSGSQGVLSERQGSQAFITPSSGNRFDVDYSDITKKI